jgi:hypothetical protein
LVPGRHYDGHSRGQKRSLTPLNPIQRRFPTVLLFWSSNILSMLAAPDITEPPLTFRVFRAGRVRAFAAFLSVFFFATSPSSR